MVERNRHRAVCQVCGRELPRRELVPAHALRPRLVDSITRWLPGWSDTGWICRADLDRARRRHIAELVATESGELSGVEREVIDAMVEGKAVASNMALEEERGLTVGQRIADRVAAVGGSWSFIGGFALVLLGWIVANSVALAGRPFDPYPFILLNLVLSCLAAIQAPIIMMSQNRQAAHDRMRAQHDYQVNLKAEIEVRQLHEKLDHLLQAQWQRLIEIQEVQIELIEEIAARARGRS